MSTRMKWMTIGGAALAVALVVSGVAMAHAGRGMSYGTKGAGGSFTYEADLENGTITDLAYVSNGTTYLLASSIALAQGDDGDVLKLAGGPHARVMAHSVNGTTFTIVLPADATVVVHEAVENWSPAGATITYAGGQTANVKVSKNATIALEGQTLTVTLGPESHASFGLEPEKGACPHGGPMAGGERAMRGPPGGGMRGGPR